MAVSLKRSIIAFSLIAAFAFSSLVAPIAGALSDSSTVYIAGSGKGKKYHYSDCRTLKKSKKKEITVEKAKDKGYTACKVCID